MYVLVRKTNLDSDRKPAPCLSWSSQVSNSQGSSSWAKCWQECVEPVCAPRCTCCKEGNVYPLKHLEILMCTCSNWIVNCNVEQNLEKLQTFKAHVRNLRSTWSELFRFHLVFEHCIKYRWYMTCPHTNSTVCFDTASLSIEGDVICVKACGTHLHLRMWEDIFLRNIHPWCILQELRNVNVQRVHTT